MMSRYGTCCVATANDAHFRSPKALHLLTNMPNYTSMHVSLSSAVCTAVHAHKCTIILSVDRNLSTPTRLLQDGTVFADPGALLACQEPIPDREGHQRGRPAVLLWAGPALPAGWSWAGDQKVMIPPVIPLILIFNAKSIYTLYIPFYTHTIYNSEESPCTISDGVNGSTCFLAPCVLLRARSWHNTSLQAHGYCCLLLRCNWRLALYHLE